MDRISLSAGGQVYSGWTKVSITRSLENMAGSFDLELTYKWQGSDDKYKAFVEPIKQGQPCVVKIGNDTVITGYVDDWVPSYDENQVIIAVSGRDKTADLVDCSVEYANSDDGWTNSDDGGTNSDDGGTNCDDEGTNRQSGAVVLCPILQYSYFSYPKW